MMAKSGDTTIRRVPISGTTYTNTIPDWIDTGQPTATDINELAKRNTETYAARNSIIPICYGRDTVFGKLFFAHVDSTTGNMYVGFTFCQGEIEAV